MSLEITLINEHGTVLERHPALGLSAYRDQLAAFSSLTEAQVKRIAAALTRELRRVQREAEVVDGL